MSKIFNKVTCMALSLTLAAGLGLNASAQTGSSSGAADISDPSIGASGPADGKAFAITGVVAKANPSPLGAEGGTVTYTIQGQHLEQQDIYIRLEKDSAPYLVIHANEIPNLVERMSSALPFLSGNVTEKSTGPIRIEKGSEKAFTIYTVAVMSTTGGAPDSKDLRWAAQPGLTITLDKLGSKPTVGDSGSSSSSSPSVPSSSSSWPDEEEESSSSGSSSLPESSVPESSIPDVPVPDPDPSVPKPVYAKIREVFSTPMPDPLTASGGGFVVSVKGSSLDENKVSVWVRVSTADGQAETLRAEGGKELVHTERFSVPANTTGQDIRYAVKAMAKFGSGKPAADDPGWGEYPMADVVVPSKKSDELQGGGKINIDQVQAITVPSPITYQGGTATIAITGTGLDTANLYVMLDGADGKEIKKANATSPEAALSDPFKLRENASKTKEQKFKISLLDYEGTGRPSERDSGWKRYGEVAVPCIAEHKIPEIDDVVWDRTDNEGVSSLTFIARGRNFDNEENSVWIKAVPRNDPQGALVLPADVGRTYASASTAPMAVKSSAKTGEIQYDIYAMAKIDTKKPTDDDKGWKKYGQTDKINEKGEPRIFGASADVNALPNEGGLVRITVEGEHLNLLSDRDFFVRMEKVTPEGVQKIADENIDLNNTVAFLVDANDSQTAGITYRYSTVLKTQQQVWGEIAVVPQMRVRAETFSAAGEPIPAFTWECGKLRLLLEGSVPAGNSVWAKVSYRVAQDGAPDRTQDQIVKFTELDGGFYTDFIDIAPNMMGAAYNADVYVVTLPMSAPAPEAADRRWSGPVASVHRPASANETISVATNAEIVPMDGELTPDGGEVKVTLEGENLKDNIFITLTTPDGSGPDITGKAEQEAHGGVAATFALPKNDGLSNRKYYVSSWATVNGKEDGPSDSAYTTEYDTTSIVQPALFGMQPTAVLPNIEGVEFQTADGVLTSKGGKGRLVIGDNSAILDYYVIFLLRSNLNTQHDQRFTLPKGVAVTEQFTIPANETSKDESYQVTAALSTTAEETPGLVWQNVASFMVPSASLAQIDSVSVELPQDSNGNLSSIWQSGGGGEPTVSISGRNLRDRVVYLKYGFASSVTQTNDVGTLILITVTSDEDISAALRIEANNTDQPIKYVVYACVAKHDTDFTWNPMNYDCVSDPVYIVQPARAKSYKITSMTSVPDNFTLGYSTGESSIELFLGGTGLANCSLRVWENKENGYDQSQRVDASIGSEGRAVFRLPSNQSNAPKIYDIMEGDNTHTPISWTRSGYSITVNPKGADDSTPQITSVKFTDPNNTVHMGGPVFSKSLSVQIQGTNLNRTKVFFRKQYAPGGDYDYQEVAVPGGTITQMNLTVKEGHVRVDIGLGESADTAQYTYVASFNVLSAPSSTSKGLNAQSVTIPADTSRKLSVKVNLEYFPPDPEARKGYYIKAGNVGPVQLGNFANEGAPTEDPALEEYYLNTATGILSFETNADTGMLTPGDYVLQLSTEGSDGKFADIPDAQNRDTPATIRVVAEPGTIPTDPEDPGDSSSGSSSGSTSGSSSDSSGSDSSGSSSNSSSNSSSSGSSSNGSWGDKETNLDGKDYTDAKENADKKNYADIVINIGNKLVVERSFFEKAENSKYDIYLRASDYEWKIPEGSSMGSDLKRSYDLTVTMSSKYDDEMQDIAGNNTEIFPFHITHSGTLPTRMLLTVETDFNRNNLWVYRYNEDDDTVTYIDEDRALSGGDVSFYLKSCSHYFVSNRRIGTARDGRYGDWTDKEYLDLGGDSAIKSNPSTGQREA